MMILSKGTGVASRIRWTALCLLAIALSGCFERQEIQQCESYAIAKLKAPSTYKRIDASGAPTPQDRPTEYTVTVSYDAANLYGVPIRETQVCVFPLKNGEPDTSKHIDFDARFESAAKAAVEKIEREAEAAVANLSVASQSRRQC